jgi:hypothetical protein
MAKKPTAQQIKDWKNLCDDVDGKFGPVDPKNINIARVVEETIARLDLWRLLSSLFSDPNTLITKKTATIGKRSRG